MKRVRVILILLLSNYCAHYAMEKPRPWYSRFFRLLKKESRKKELTQEQKDQELITFIEKGWMGNEVWCIKELINSGANINATDAQGRTLLMRSAPDTDLELIKFFLIAGADVNMHCKVIRKPDASVYQRLLEDQMIRGPTALMSAVWNSNHLLVQLLLNEGADRTMQNTYGKTAMDIAQLIKDEQIIKLLSEKKKIA